MTEHEGFLYWKTRAEELERERDALKAAVEELNKRVDVYRVELVMEAYDRVKTERDALRVAIDVAKALLEALEPRRGSLAAKALARLEAS